jgi:hypothetical protein
MSIMERANETGFRIKSGMTKAKAEGAVKTTLYHPQIPPQGGVLNSPEARTRIISGTTDIRMTKLMRNEGICKLEAIKMKGQGRAKCFTGEVNVKQESKEINGLQGAPPPTPL